MGLQLLIVGVVYVFGMVLIVRQFAGLYPEYFVTTGRSGLAIRKAVYSNVAGVDTLRASETETVLGVRMESGERLDLILPTDRVSVLYESIQRNKPDP
jgi:hypothetical protein